MYAPNDHATAQRGAELRLAGKLSEARSYLESAMERSTGAERAAIAIELAQIDLREAAWHRAEQRLDEALRLLGPSAQTDAPNLWAAANERKAWTLYRQGRIDEGRDIAENLRLAMIDSHGVNPSIRASLENTLGGIAWSQRRLDDVVRHTEEAVRLYDEAEDYVGSANGHANLGVLYFSTGDWKRAIREFDMAEEIRVKHRIMAGRPTVVFNLGVISLALGNYERAREQFQSCLELSREMGEQYEPLQVVMALAHLELLEGRIEEACGKLDEVLASPALSHADRVQASWLKALVECDQRRADRGISLAGEARKAARDANLLGSEIECCLALATAHRRIKNYASAEAVLHDAIALAERAGDPYHRAVALLELGELRREMSEPDFRKMAEEASSVFEKLGAQRHIDRARSLMM